MRMTRWLPRLPAPLLALAALGALVWPLVYAFWLSFTPGEMLEPPRGDWSLRWYREFFSRPRWMQGLVNSLGVGAGTVLLSTVAGGGAAVAVSRHRFRGRRALGVAVLSPLFVPALIFGITLLPAMRTMGLWGTHFSVAAAHAMWGMPLVYLSVRDALDRADPEVELAARGLGASPAACFRLVTLPLLTPALSVGAAMAFIVSLNELVMALFLCTAATDTLPKVIWPNLRYTLSPLVAAASGVTVVATVLLLLLATWAGARNRTRRARLRASGKERIAASPRPRSPVPMS